MPHIIWKVSKIHLGCYCYGPSIAYGWSRISNPTAHNLESDEFKFFMVIIQTWTPYKLIYIMSYYILHICPYCLEDISYNSYVGEKVKLWATNKIILDNLVPWGILFKISIAYYRKLLNKPLVWTVCRLKKCLDDKSIDQTCCLVNFNRGSYIRLYRNVV